MRVHRIQAIQNMFSREHIMVAVLIMSVSVLIHRVICGYRESMLQRTFSQCSLENIFSREHILVPYIRIPRVICG